MRTLENSYCVPKTEGEWIMLAPYYPQELRHYDSIKEWMHDFTRCGHVNFMKFYPNLGVSENNHGRTEIPVQHFVDLVEDKITPWMLEEVGFINRVFRYDLDLAHDWNGFIVKRKIVEQCGIIKINGEDTSITTFTDLLTLIKFLTPPAK